MQEFCSNTEFDNNTKTKALGLKKKCIYFIERNERTFNKLKLIKNHLRSTTREKRLNALMFLSIKKDIADQIDLNKLTSLWSTLKQHQIRFGKLCLNS